MNDLNIIYGANSNGLNKSVDSQICSLDQIKSGLQLDFDGVSTASVHQLKQLINEYLDTLAERAYIHLAWVACL